MRVQTSHRDPSANRRTVRTSTIVIVVLWAYGLGDAVWAGLTVRADEFTTGMPVWFGVIAVLMPLLGFPLGSLFMKRAPFAPPGLVRWIDSRAGDGATADFLRRWRPLLMLSVCAAIYALVLAVRLATVGTATHEWWSVGFLGSGAAGFALAHVILRWRGVPGA